MKQFKFLLVAIAPLVFASSCVEKTHVEEVHVVEQVNVVEKPSPDCSGCGIENRYKYNMKIKTYSGTAYFYSNYKHEVGDTLLSSKMFIQQEVEERSRLKNEVIRLQALNDSLIKSNNTMKFQYELMYDFYEKNIINKRDN